MNNQIHKWALLLAVVVLLAAYLVILFYRGFNDPDEGRSGELPRKMVANHNWLEMRMRGYRYYEKSPLAYWLVAPAIKIFGAHDWAVRIPLLFSGLFGLYLFWRTAAARFGREVGASAALAMASTVGFAGAAGSDLVFLQMQ